VSGWQLRALRPADVPVIAELEQRLFPLDAWPLEMFVDEVSQPTRSYLVAEAGPAAEPGTDTRVVGYCGVMCVDTMADIQTIAVTPEHEGRGIGTAMLTQMIDEAGRRGAEQVLLEVRSDNLRARALYVRFGFRHIHTRPRYYRDGADALVMRLELASAARSGPAVTAQREGDIE
jgi:ribosomal-protein-alanine N-acetyltransferase